MKNESKILLICFLLAMYSLLVFGCYKEYIDLKYKVAIIKMSNK